MHQNTETSKDKGFEVTSSKTKSSRCKLTSLTPGVPRRWPIGDRRKEMLEFVERREEISRENEEKMKIFISWRRKVACKN